MNYFKFNRIAISPLVAFAMFFVGGCATGPNKLKDIESLQHFVNGNDVLSLGALEEANKGIENRDLPYYLNKSTLLRIGATKDLESSSKNLLQVDANIDNWISEATLNLNKSTNDFATYLIANKQKNTYELKDFEKSMVGYYLALNYALTGSIEKAFVGAKKIAERETIINRFNERKVVAIQARESDEQKKGSPVFSSLNEIKGYPINLLDSPEVGALKNSYQNAAAHFLAGYIFEANNEPGLSAPGYRQALELKPGTQLFSDSLSNLDKNIARRGENKNTSDVLVVMETGNVPRISTHRSNFTLNLKKGTRIATIRLPVMGQSINTFRPTSIRIGMETIPLVQVANIDAMARRQLKDDMPTHVLKATTQAFVQIIAQEAAQAAAEKNKNSNSGLAGAFAAIAVGAALSVGDADERMWSNLPGAINMGRSRMNKGMTNISVPTPSGLVTISVNINQDYQVVYIRTLGGRAFLTSANEIEMSKLALLLAK